MRQAEFVEKYIAQLLWRGDIESFAGKRVNLFGQTLDELSVFAFKRFQNVCRNANASFFHIAQNYAKRLFNVEKQTIKSLLRQLLAQILAFRKQFRRTGFVAVRAQNLLYIFIGALPLARCAAIITSKNLSCSKPYVLLIDL